MDYLGIVRDFLWQEHLNCTSRSREGGMDRKLEGKQEADCEGFLPCKVVDTIL